MTTLKQRINLGARQEGLVFSAGTFFRISYFIARAKEQTSKSMTLVEAKKKVKANKIRSNVIDKTLLRKIQNIRMR